MIARNELAIDATAHGADHNGTMLNAVSNEMVALYRPGATAYRDWAIVLRRPQ